MITFDLKNLQIKVNENVYKLNDDNEFISDDNQVYVVYYTTLSTRTHYKVADYVDRDFKVPAIISKASAVKLIQYFANISAHSISLSSVPVSHSFAETMEMLKNELAAIGASTLAATSPAEHHDDVKKNALDKTLSILGTILNSINLSDCEHGIKAGKPVHISLNTNGQPIHVILEQLLEFIFAYTSYSETIISYHSLNTCNYILYSVMRILFIEQSEFQSDLFTTKTDLILHYFISILVDLVTDKSSYELYIKRRHPEAANIVRKYHTKYPILYRVLAKTDIQKLPRSFFEEAAAEPIKMLPYIATYNMQPKERILYVYEVFVNEFAKNSASLSEQPKQSSTFFSSEEFWNILENLTVGLENDKYNTETFISTLPKLLSILKDNPDIDPSVGELLHCTGEMLC